MAAGADQGGGLYFARAGGRAGQARPQGRLSIGLGVRPRREGKAIRDLIRSAGAKLFYLPKYSPDLNPIEQVFAKLKHLLRKAAARTIETVCAAIGQILGAFTPEECANYFRNSGYPT